MIEENIVNRKINEGKQLACLQKEMEDYWPELVDEILTDKQFSRMKSSMKWLKIVLENNVPFGKKFRGLSLLSFYRAIKPSQTPEEVKSGLILAWCLEILQAAYLIADDMMDNSTTRRGKPCWYLMEGVGNTAINDVLLLENIVNRIIDRHFLNCPNYNLIMKLVHDTNLQTLLGENLDTKLGMDDFDFSSFNTETYEAIVEFKTSYYTFYEPAAMAMLLAGRTKEDELASLKEIMLKIGYLFQIQDDFLDCYGDEQVTGKIGTDIDDRKCTWLIVKALQIALPSQLEELQESYGQPGKVEIVKSIYSELGIPERFHKTEEDLYTEISKSIENLTTTALPKKPMYRILNLIYKRQK